jgi:hypothetical protein
VYAPRRNWDFPPTPHPQASVPPPPCFWREGNTLWRERGWESPNSDEGHTLWYSLYVRTLCSKFPTYRLVPISQGPKNSRIIPSSGIGSPVRHVFLWIRPLGEGGIFQFFYMYFFLHCFICSPSDSIVPIMMLELNLMLQLLHGFRPFICHKYLANSLYQSKEVTHYHQAESEKYFYNTLFC